MIRDEDVTRRIEALEQLCREEVGRNIGQMAIMVKGGMEFAARSLANGSRGSVVIATGCFVPFGNPAAAETDGPIGAIIVARALQSIGREVSLVTDRYCLSALEFTRSMIVDWQDEVAIGVVDADAREPTYAVGNPPKSIASHVIAIERLGPGSDGKIRSMAGQIRNDVSGYVHEYYAHSTAFKIGIGDGGNELGMGSADHDIVTNSVEMGGQIHCVVPCDALIVSGCSNWGAYGLAASLSILRPGAISPDLFSQSLHHRILVSLVTSGNAVDGISGKPTLSVDGITESRLNSKLASIARIVDL